MKIFKLKQKFWMLMRVPLLYYYFKKHVIKNKLIQEDIFNNNLIKRSGKKEGEFKQFYKLMMFNKEFAYLFDWRIRKMDWLGRMLFYHKLHFKIFSSTQIAGGLVFFHPYGTVINAKQIGKNFVFRNGLTIGNKNNNNNLLPIIGDNVEVGANVVIIGDINIGNNVIIGAGSVVVKDVPSNVIIAGNPAKIIKELN